MEFLRLLLQITIELFISITAGILAFVIPLLIFHHYSLKRKANKIGPIMYDDKTTIKEHPEIETEPKIDKIVTHKEKVKGVINTPVPAMLYDYPVYIGPLPYSEDSNIKPYVEEIIIYDQKPTIGPAEYSDELSIKPIINPINDIRPVEYADDLKIKPLVETVETIEKISYTPFIGPVEYHESINIKPIKEDK